jgi:hypothetical protein
MKIWRGLIQELLQLLESDLSVPVATDLLNETAALERLVDRYETHLNHLVFLAEDLSLSIKSVDQQNLKGHLLKWRNAKMLLGCGVFLD